MSLLVRLPLNGNLNNYGSADVTVTNNGATISNDGKLGKCYYFNGSSTMVLPSFEETRSISFWIKSPKTNSTIAFVDYKSKLGFGFQSNGYIIVNCASSSLKMYNSSNFIANQWNHITVTRDDSFTDVLLYINGILQTTRIDTNNNWTNNVDGCYIGGRSTGTNMTCYINDFRVYNHTLSESEIRHFIKGKGLQIWLPLTGDLIQQGLSNVTITNVGATVDSSGKIGKCYSFDGSDDGIRIDGDILPQLQKGDFSICFWLFSNDAGNRSIYIATTPASDWGFSIEKTTTNKLRVYWQNNPDFNSSLDIPDQQWCHIAVVIKDGNCYCYKNGEKLAERTSGDMTPAKLSRTWIYAQLGRDTRTGSTVLKGKMNDFRWYDHALSQKEVKELSKGLVLHYPLNKNTTYTSLIDKTANYNIYNNYKVTASLTATGETYLGSPVRRLSMTPDDNHLSNFKTSLGSHGVYNWHRTFSASTKYVFWIYYKPVSHMDVRVGGTASNISGWTEIPPKAVGDGWYVVGQYRDGSVTSDKSDSIFVSFYSPTAETGIPILIDFACPTLVQWLTEIQPSINYGGNNIVYDCSGYCNNATIINTLHTANDTPKYQASTQFDTTSTKIKLPVMSFTGMANSYTFAWWQYNTSTGNMPWGFSDGNRLNCYHCSPLCWNTGDGSSNQFKDGSTIIAPTTVQNGWHHMVVTGDGTATKLYIDGVYRGTATTYKALTGTQIWISGWDSGTSYTFNGSKESDFRIYATALSADDIAELYNGGVL